MSAPDLFALPNRAKIAGRSSVITHAFASGVIPSIMPTEDEVSEALKVLGMSEQEVVCAYCGDPATEWDHLNAIIRNGAESPDTTAWTERILSLAKDALIDKRAICIIEVLEYGTQG